MSRRSLSELEPKLRRRTRPLCHEPAAALADAQGLLFVCPSCWEKLGQRAGAHSILVWFGGRGVPDDERPRALWDVSGSSLADLTLSPSINCDIPYVDERGVLHESSCKFHGFVTSGEVTW